MNLTEFNALKAGDRIENAMSGSTGEVVEADSKGVQVRWNVMPWRAGHDAPGVLRHYSRFSTIWFHWSKIENVSAHDGPPEPEAADQGQS